MTIIKSSHEISITSSEAYRIAWDIYSALKHTCETHWVNHPHAFHEHEKERIGRMKTFFTLGNEPHLFDGFLKEMEEIVRPKDN